MELEWEGGGCKVLYLMPKQFCRGYTIVVVALLRIVQFCMHLKRYNPPATSLPPVRLVGPAAALASLLKSKSIIPHQQHCNQAILHLYR
jgi:hypothetical protein